MPNKQYISGRNHEYVIKRKWEKDGWTVLRTAGSHGEFDLVAIRRPTDCHCPCGKNAHGYITLIQAKSGKNAERERKKLESLKAEYEGTYSVRVELL